MKVSSITGINIIIITLFLIFLYMFAHFKVLRISGISMEPRISEDQIIVIYRGSYGLPYMFKSGYIFNWKKPDKEDIIVFHNPMDNSLSVKRCVGIPGDLLVLKHSTFYINGTPLPEPPLPPASSFHNGFLPENWYFLVGDNYGKSVDSRTFGPVPIDLMIGTVIFPADRELP